MTQIQPVQLPQYQIIPQQPSYNAVKIDINNPQVNAPSNLTNQNQLQPQNQQQASYPAPIYSYPQAPIYEVPQQSIYKPELKVAQTTEQPKAIQDVPMVPPPVIIQPQIKQQPVVASAAPITTPIAATSTVTASIATPVVAPAPAVKINEAPVPAQKVDVKTPEIITPKVDVNEFINRLTSADYEEQANTMEAIAEMVQTSPKQATELLDVRIIENLLGIINKDSSTLTGPSAQQLQIREKIISGQSVTDAEKAEANKISPMEQAERNKQYAIYTVAILQKLYASEIEKINNIVVPMTELPGAAGIVEQIKKNPNPMIRVASIDALSYIQRPEYKQDLATLFSVAQNDQDKYVQETAKKALEKITKPEDTKVEAAPVQSATAEVKPTEKNAA